MVACHGQLRCGTPCRGGTRGLGLGMGFAPMELEVPAGAQVQVRLGTNTSDATIAQSFSWTSGTRMGTIDIEIEPPADLGPNPCGSGCFVSVAPVPQTPPSPWALGSFMIALAWLGRRTASRPPSVRGAEKNLLKSRIFSIKRLESGTVPRVNPLFVTTVKAFGLVFGLGAAFLAACSEPTQAPCIHVEHDSVCRWRGGRSWRRGNGRKWRFYRSRRCWRRRAHRAPVVPEGGVCDRLRQEGYVAVRGHRAWPSAAGRERIARPIMGGVTRARIAPSRLKSGGR